MFLIKPITDNKGDRSPNIFTIYKIDIGCRQKCFSGSLPPLIFTGDPINQGITGNIKGDLDQDILVAVVSAVVVPVEESLLDIGIVARIVAINLE